jgi:hypothetical protein
MRQHLYKLLILISILGLFILINYFLYKTVEQFADASGSPVVTEVDVQKLLEGITKRLCPVMLEIQKTIADNAAAERAQDAGGTKPVTLPKDVDAAFQFMLQESKTLLFSCPAPTSMYQLPSDFSTQLTKSMDYSYTKLSSINKNIQNALDGNAGSSDNTNIADYYKNMSDADKATYDANFKLFTTEKAPVDISKMSATDKEALLSTRYQDLQTVLATTDKDGSNYVDKLLSSLELEFTKLQKTKKKANTGAIYAESSAASEASSKSFGNAKFYTSAHFK